MAIAQDSAVEFFGTQDTLGNASTTVADAAFSVIGTGGTDAWTNDDDAPTASITLLADWNTTAPDVNSSVNLYVRPLNVTSTFDGEVPDANHLHHYVGSFPTNDVLTNQYITITITLPNYKTSSEFEFYIENKTGETIQAGWDLYITPKTIGPHPA